MKKSTFSPELLLHSNGLRVTPIRILILRLLHETTLPLTVEAIVKKVQHIADTATSYRTLNTFVEKNIVRKLDIMDGRASFELNRTSGHFHYVICQNCNSVEPIVLCIKNIHNNALKKTKKFKVVSDHQLTFWGTCKKCVRTIR